MAEYIDRKAAISLIKQYGMDAIDGGRYSLDAVDDGIDLVKGIKALPAADVVPVVHWVLTDEKLPPEGQDVLCWYEYFRFGSYNRMFQTYGIGYQYNGMWGGEVAQGQKARVLAWIPLPETPKMDGGGNDGNV